MYIWQKEQWSNIMQRKQSLPHALLLHGQAGIGKHEFALDVAATLLCTVAEEEGAACGKCAHCLWFKEGAHPDFKLIAPEDMDESNDSPKKKKAKKSQISVAQIRELYEYLGLSSHQSNGKRIVLISPADTLNVASANALLKILEEPPADTVFILVSNQPQRLLPTIVSRCQAISMTLPTTAEAVSWLKEQGLTHAEMALDYAGGAPLLAMQFEAQMEINTRLFEQLERGAHLDPSSSAPLFLSLGMEHALDVLQKWIFDLANFTFLKQLRYHKQHVNALQALSNSVKLKRLLVFQQGLVDAKKTAAHPLSNEMQLENILLKYTQLFKS